MKLIVKPASREEVIWLSSRLRPEDQLEVKTATGRSVEHALLNAFHIAAECYTVRFNDEPDPVALFGIAIGYPMVGVPWFLATPEVTRGSIALLREAPKWLKAWAQTYGGLHNIVDPRNDLHVRWLYDLGCRFGNHSVVINEQPFIPFFYN